LLFLAEKWEAYEIERGNELDDFSVVEVMEQDLKSIFDPVVDEILELIVAQLIQVPDFLQLLRSAPSVTCALGLGFCLRPLVPTPPSSPRSYCAARSRRRSFTPSLARSCAASRLLCLPLVRLRGRVASRSVGSRVKLSASSAPQPALRVCRELRAERDVASLRKASGPVDKQRSSYTDSAKLTTEELLSLPTGPRERLEILDEKKHIFN
jgi:hypothetical protein